MAGINYQAMAPGMSRLALAIGGGGQRRGYDDGLLLESRVAQAAASTHAANEAARLRSLEADAEEEAKLRRAPDAILRTTLTQHSIPTEEAGAVSEYLKTGALGGKYAPGAGGMGPVAPQPDWMDRLGAVSRAIGTTQQALTTGDKSVENIAKADQLRNLEARKDKLFAQGPLTPTQLATVEYAGKGSAPYSFNEYGVGNQLTGQVDDTGGPAGRFAQYRNSTTAAQKANAVQSYASADASRASAAKTRAETSRDARGADIKEVIGPDGSVYLVNKVTGLTRQVVGADGRPLVSGRAGGSGTGAGKPMTEGQAKANMFGGRMTEADAILSQLEDEGVRDTGITKNIVQSTVGVLPLVGDKLSEAAGAGMNILPGIAGGPSGKQQQVEQARRDFVNAVLRRESGAVISPQEFANAEKQYFPQPGDSDEVLAQKRRNRALATQLMLQEVPDHHRYQRKPPAMPPKQAPGGATGSWGDQPAAGGGWRIERVN